MLVHRALPYDSDEEFLNTAEPFLTEGIERSDALLAVTTSINIELLRTRLGAGARHVAFVEAATWYRTPASALSSYRAFLDARLEEGAPWVRIIGEPVWAGRSASEVRLWTRYESLLNIAFGPAPATILCPYDTRSLDPEIVSGASATHPHTIGSDGIIASPEYANPLGFLLET
ncbi:MAG: MEDS domain-containing protein [Solirubrobacteraceae bacterium]